MVKVSVIAPKEDISSNADIEIVKTLESSNADYVYFKNVNDDLYPDLLIEAYEKAEENRLDYVVLNSQGLDTEEIGIYELEGFEGDIFETDFKITSKLIKKSLIKDTFDKDMYLFNFDVILSAVRFSFLDSDVVFEDEPFDNIDEAISKINRIFPKLTDYRMYGALKEGFFNYKLKKLFYCYDAVPEDEQEETYWKLKDDFIQIIYHPLYLDFTVGISRLNKMFFDDIAYTEDFNEFNKYIPYYYIKLDVIDLKDEIVEIEMENRRIRQETNRLNKMNRDILNSKSWSLTKPLRDIKRTM